MWVIKLGGSLTSSQELPSWLGVIGRTPGPPRVVVPGGGPFADAVRAAQARWGFDERIAHRMALLGMQQYGLMLTGLEPKLQPVETLEAIHAECAAQRVPVWQPFAMVANRDDIEASWDVTSDSLALWLAIVLGAERLILIKSAKLPGSPTALGYLVENGILDCGFPRFADRFTGAIFCIKRGQHRALADGLTRGESAGTRVLL